MKEDRLSTPQDRLLSAPISVWEKIDAAIKFYASYETYMSPRTGGVASGCPRSGPSPISLDHGRAASEVLMELVKLYPLAVEEAPPSETAPTGWTPAKERQPEGDGDVLVAHPVYAKTATEWCGVTVRSASTVRSWVKYPEDTSMADGFWMYLPKGPL